MRYKKSIFIFTITASFLGLFTFHADAEDDAPVAHGEVNLDYLRDIVWGLATDLRQRAYFKRANLMSLIRQSAPDTTRSVHEDGTVLRQTAELAPNGYPHPILGAFEPEMLQHLQQAWQDTPNAYGVRSSRVLYSTHYDALSGQFVPDLSIGDYSNPNIYTVSLESMMEWTTLNPDLHRELDWVKNLAQYQKRTLGSGPEGDHQMVELRDGAYHSNPYEIYALSATQAGVPKFGVMDNPVVQRMLANIRKQFSNRSNVPKNMRATHDTMRRGETVVLRCDQNAYSPIANHRPHPTYNRYLDTITIEAPRD